MSESFRKDNSNLSKCNDIISSGASILHANDLTITKSGTFDAELDLLETTLSELKQGEIESSTGEFCQNLVIEDHDDIESQLDNDSNLKASQESELFKASCVQTSLNACENISSDHLDYVLTNPQRFKSICHEGSNLISDDIPVNPKFSLLESGSAKYEVTNSCTVKNCAKPVSNDDAVQTSSGSNCDDKSECGRQQCLSLENLEVINPSTNCPVSLGLRGEQARHKNNKSDQGCDFYIDAKKSHINQVDKLSEKRFELVTDGLCSRECLSNLALTMEGAVSDEYQPNESNKAMDTLGTLVSDLTTVNSGVPEIGDKLSSKETTLKNQENMTVNEEGKHLKTDNAAHKFINDFVTDKLESDNINITPKLEADDVTLKLKTDTLTYKLETHTVTSNLETDNVVTKPENETVKSKMETDSVASKLENYTTPKKECSEVTLRCEVQDCEEPIKKQGIFSSTPNVDKNLQNGLINRPSFAPDFGLVSPLDVKLLKGKNNLKRKFTGLKPIEEIDEAADTIAEKKVKTEESASLPEASTSTLPCYEAPAKSLLKMWQPSCLSRNVSASSFIVLDECGETELEDCSKLSQDHETMRADDFEIAYQSLTEELLKSSTNIETLEKYHSQVQLENQMDDEKFDEILKELTMIVDVEDKTCLSLRSMDESTISESCHVISAVKEAVDTVISGTENKGTLPNDGSLSKSNTITEENHSVVLSVDKNRIDSFKKEVMVEKRENSSTSKEASELKPVKNEHRDEEQDMDEEDFLLEGNNAKDKPYEFFEFVSSDPKENEDNYNPEWQKLGRLTSDEERYKAVRDRWRSLVPPDPNRNLTYRQWRSRNNKPPITLAPLNNNHQMMDDIVKNQLCTAVFDNKIGKIVKECEDSRMKIFRERNNEFERLARVQDEEQRKASMYGFSYQEMAQLHCRHLNQCRAVKVQYDQELKRINSITEDKLRILREAKEEVMLFQKFYKGVGASDESELYMTDIQVQELMETEEMLEQYKVFYK